MEKSFENSAARANLLNALNVGHQVSKPVRKAQGNFSADMGTIPNYSVHDDLSDEKHSFCEQVLDKLVLLVAKVEMRSKKNSRLKCQEVLKTLITTYSTKEENNKQKTYCK